MATVQAYTKFGVDAKFNSRSNMTMVHNGGGTPDISAYPDSKTGDVIERASDGARWAVVASTINPIAGRVLSVAGKAGHVTLVPGDVGAAPSSHTHTKAQITDLNASTSASSNSIAQRGSGGVLVVGTPTATTHATTKAYVDSRVSGGIIWSNLAGKPSTFPPSTHTHTVSQISDIKLSEHATPHSVTKRSVDGHVRVPFEPVWDEDAASKHYVDSTVTAGATWASLAGKPSTYPPSSHNHTVSQITDLNITDLAITNTVVKRSDKGQVRVALDPVWSEDATSKQYVDSKIASTDITIENPNLNDVTTPGHYVQRLSANATEANNYPKSAEAGHLVVVRNGQFASQEYTDYRSKAKYYRSKHEEDWYSWKIIADKDYVDNSVTSGKAWAAITDKPSTFPPSDHTHTIAQIRDLFVATSLTPNTVALRTDKGQVRVALEPVWSEDATSRQYVDTQVSASKAWSAITDKPTTFAPSTHSHTQAQVTGLPAKLNTHDAAAAKVNSAISNVSGSTTNSGSLLSLTTSGRLTAVDPAGVTDVANKRYVDAQISAKTTWANTSGKPTTFPPNTHTHTVAQITGLTLSQSPTGSSVVQRDSSGRATVSTPTATGHATTKAYVDNAVTAGKSWTAITGKPSTFPPSWHTHTVGQITDMSLSIHAGADTVALRSATGQVRVALEPVWDEDAASKGYVDATSKKHAADQFESARLTTENLNDVTTPGNYYQIQTVNATTARNYPVGAQAGHLVVMQGGTFVKQEYTDHRSESMFYRTNYDGQWFAWRSISQSIV